MRSAGTWPSSARNSGARSGPHRPIPMPTLRTLRWTLRWSSPSQGWLRSSSGFGSLRTRGPHSRRHSSTEAASPRLSFPMPELNLTRILRSNLLAQPDSVPATIESLGGDIGASDVVVYLVDFGQQFLEPLGNYSGHNE